METNYMEIVLSALLGTIFSIGLAIATYAIERKRNLRNARDELIKSINFNHTRADQMSRQFAERIAPNYKFDTTGLIIWLSRTSGLINDELRGKINWHRYQMDHANSILETYYVIIRTPQGGEGGTNILHQDISEIFRRLKDIQENTESIIEELRKV